MKIGYVLLLSTIMMSACGGNPEQAAVNNAAAHVPQPAVNLPSVPQCNPSPLVDGYLVPCPTANAAHPDVLYRQGVNIFAVGSNNSFSLLSPGNYTTTDTRNCNFTVTAIGDVQ